VQYFLYNVFSTLALTVALPLLPLLFLLGERFRAGLRQRCGFYSPGVVKALRPGAPIWIHAASVGEVSAAARLAAELRRGRPGRKIVLSTFTAGGHYVARQVAAADAAIFLPLDQRWIVRRALAKLNPAVLIVLETELWPNLLREAYLKGIPTLLLSGRLSERACRRYVLFRPLFQRVMSCLSAIGVQSTEDAERMIRLGADPARISVVGNLKRAPLTPELKGAIQSCNGTAAGARANRCPLLVVGSSHRGEEEVLLNVFVTLKKSFPDLRMVLAPRHPQRFAEVETLLAGYGVSFERRSALGDPSAFTQDILLLDSLGELERFYTIADIAFVGGSFVDVGGHNVLEPARLGKPTFFGPFMDNFKAVAQELKQSGGGIEVRNGDELTAAIAELLRDPEKRKLAGDKAYQVAAEDAGVLGRSMALAERYLEARSQRYVP
jgi:3-deoxy-D-manno-octulosonic-acid transferase